MYKKMIPILLLIILILQLVTIYIHINYEHNHEECEICSLIYMFEYNLKGYSPNNYYIVLLMIICPYILKSVYEKTIYDRKENTLIGLKVELNN